MFNSQTKAFKFASKRTAAIVATLALALTGVVAISASPAQAAEPSVKYNVRVNRDVANGQTAVVRPGETVSLYVAAYLDTRSNGSTMVTDLAVGDLLSFAPNLTTTLTPQNTQFNWYVTGDGPCYGTTLPQTQEIAWTEAMKTCGGGAGAKYVNPYWSARLTNNTNENVTFAVAPKFVIPGAADGLPVGTAGLNYNTQATFEANAVTSYTATDSDINVHFETTDGLCLARDLTVGSAFKSRLQVAANGQPVTTTDDGSNTYADPNVSVRHLPVGEAYATQTVPGSAKVIGYSVEAGRVTLTTDGPHEFTGTNVDVNGTGALLIDAFNSTYAYAVTTTTLTILQSVAMDDTAYTEVTGATVTGDEGGQYHQVPADSQGVKVNASAYVQRPLADAVYTPALTIVDNADGATSVARSCGPVAPTFTIDAASSTYNSIAVTIDQTPSATSYSCRAYTTAGVLVYTGYLTEENRAAGQKCQVYSLSGSTSYDVKVAATSNFEGTGPESEPVSHTTIAGGGGGVYVPPTMVTPELAAPSGSTSIKVTAPSLKTMNSAITVTDTSRAYAGANGDVFYGSAVAGTITVVNNTAAGANTKFAGSGKLVITGASTLSSVGWIGTKGTGFAVLYRNTAFNNVVKWGSLNSASGIKTREITQAKLSAFCTAAAGSGYTSGGLILTSSAMSAPFIRVECMNPIDMTKPNRTIFATVSTSSTSPLVKTSAQITNYTSSTYGCVAVSIGANKAATSSTSALLAVATTYAKTVVGSNSYCQFGSGAAIAKREILSISGSGKKLASSLPSATVIPADVTGFSAVPGKSKNTWVVLTSGVGSLQVMPGMKFIMNVDSKAKAVKGKNITYSSASAASNAKFATYSTIAAVGQLSSGTITGVRSGNVIGSTNQSWAAVSISLSTGVVTTGQAITITASSYTGTQTSARNLNITSATSDSKKVNVYVLADAVTKKYKAATWTLPTK
ncbi:hypothetical protein [Rhodoluna limnophila]|uniref:hypothetical protein n=1 Tax=Rhodoluna limnophila TaxID=232537 RepID=UPI001106D439|nr:hypothetical protein [Rhodoluna limnophila]